MHISGVAENNITSDILRERIGEQYSCICSNGEASPSLAIDTDWEGYLARCPKKWRYTLKKLLGTMESKPELDVQWYHQANDLESFYGVLLHIEARSWKAREGTAITRDSLEYLYYRELLPRLAHEEAFIANVITFDGTPIAYNLCYLWNGEMGSMKTSFDEAYSDLSPGTLAYCTSVRYAFEQGAQVYDFLGDKAQHKTKWTDHIVKHQDYLLLLPTLPSRLAGALRSLRGLMRSGPSR